MKFQFSNFKLSITGFCLSVGAVGFALSTLPIASLKEFPKEKGESVMSPMLIPGSNTVLNGAMVYNDLWAEQNPNGSYTYDVEAGIYSIQARPDGKITKLQSVNALSKMRAGYCLNGTYYVISAENSDTKFYLTTYSTSNWAQRSREEIDYVNVPSDLTYDPVTKKTYGFFYNDETQEYDRFCSFSTSYGEATPIGRGMDRNCFAIAANTKGEIYGIWGYTGWLIKVNPKTGSYEQIGRLGVYPDYVNSLTFDDATGKLYWASNNDDGKSALYEINLTSGAATKIMDFPNNATFAGIYAQAYSVPTDAPAEVSEVNISFASVTSPEATVSFKAPLLTVGGAPLSGTLDILVESAVGEKIVEKVSPGDRASCQIMLPEGVSEITLTPCTEVLRGAPLSVSAFAGEDIPEPPVEVSLTEKDGKPHLTWKAPTKGKNGGAIDYASLRYRVIRQTDSKEVAKDLSVTEWTDSDFTGTAAVSYAVYASTSKGESTPAVSEKIVFGEGFTVPWSEGFDSKDAFDLWTVVDLNGNSTWKYDTSKKYICSPYDDIGPAEDWIFSPRFQLQKGKTYQVELDASTLYDSKASYAENFDIWLSTSASPEGKCLQIVRNENFLSRNVQRKKAIFTAPADGWFNLGIFTDSPKSHWQLNIDNIFLTEVDSRVPGPVTNLVLQPAGQGNLSISIMFNAPLVDTEGRQLDGLVDVLIYRDDVAEPTSTYTNITPGERITCYDVVTTNGVHRYRLVTRTVAGLGAEVSESAFIGKDVPGAPRDLKAVQTPDGLVHLSWKVPLTGANGGYYDDLSLYYRVVRSDGEVLATNLKDCELIDSSLKLTRQELMYYLVTPYVNEGKGAYANTEYDLFGPLYVAPLSETFAGADMKWYPWISESDGPNHLWSLETTGVNPVAADQNGDRGLAMFTSNATTKGVTGTFSSPKIDVSELKDAEVSFRMYHSKSTDASTNEGLEVYWREDGGEWMLISQDAILRDNGSEGWQRHAITLPSGSKTGRVRFSCKALGGANIHLDNISFESGHDADVELVSISVPSKFASGEEIPCMVTIANAGSKRLENISVEVAAAGLSSVKGVCPQLEPGKSADVNLILNFTQTGKTTLIAEATAEGDLNTANNSQQKSVEVVTSIIPGVTGLYGAVEGNTVNLSWETTGESSSVKDDMEDYQDWAIDEIGDWIMVDIDRDVTCRINKDLESYPNENSPKAFQVCNAAKLGINIWPQGTPVSGDKMLMSIANINTVNNDWMISPMLNGAEQTVSFYAKAFTAEDVNPEKMVVYASSGSTNPDDFVKISSSEYLVVPDTWTRYTFHLPEGTRRFAIRCVSDDAFALFIDDVCFSDMTVAPVKTLGYEVYRNGEKVAETSGPSFVDNLPADHGSSVKYRVRALYDGGRFGNSEELVVATPGAGVEDNLGSNVKVYSTGGAIIVIGAEGKRIRVISADGKTLGGTKCASEKERFGVISGVYLVNIDGALVKIVVP